MELTSHPLASQSSPWLLPGTELLSAVRPQLSRLLPTTATEVMADMVLAATEPTTLATVMAVTARGLLTPRLMPTTAMEDMVDTVLATPLATVLATAMAVTARGLLTLRPTPTTPTEDMVDTDR